MKMINITLLISVINVMRIMRNMTNITDDFKLRICNEKIVPRRGNLL